MFRLCCSSVSPSTPFAKPSNFVDWSKQSGLLHVLRCTSIWSEWEPVGNFSSKNIKEGNSETVQLYISHHNSLSAEQPQNSQSYPCRRPNRKTCVNVIEVTVNKQRGKGYAGIFQCSSIREKLLFRLVTFAGGPEPPETRRKSKKHSQIDFMCRSMLTIFLYRWIWIWFEQFDCVSVWCEWVCTVYCIRK